MISDGAAYWRSFAGGEVPEELLGRLDLPRYNTGLALCRNFEVLPHGPVRNRAGFQFTREVKTSSALTRLIPFIRANGQALIIEMGAGYFRFHANGATVLSAGVPYEVANTYAEADLFDIEYAQKIDTITFTHPSYQQRDLTRVTDTSWTFGTVSFGSGLTPPTGSPQINVTVDGPAAGANPSNYVYVATSLDDDGDESVASTENSVNNDLWTAGHRNLIAVNGLATGATRYNIYKGVRVASGTTGVVFGFIGQTAGAVPTFIDQNIEPDYSLTPPVTVDALNGANKWPVAVAHFEQRRIFGGSNTQPQSFWGTNTGFDDLMIARFNPKDDDGFEFTVASLQANAVRHIVALNDLLVFTTGAVLRIYTPNGEALTPNNVASIPVSNIGATKTRPVIAGEDVLYPNVDGEHIIALRYSADTGKLATTDVSLAAPHLIDSYTWKQLAFAVSPYPIMWGARSDGKLIGMTYVPEQQVIAWHQHDTDGYFESIAVIPENGRSVLYAVIRRVINGATVRFVEFMRDRAFASLGDAFVVDAGLSYSGAPATTISGLSHLNGATVAVLADGKAIGTKVVSGGQITLAEAASKVHVGLGYTGQVQMLPLAYEVPGFGVGDTKNINEAAVRVKNTVGLRVGPNFVKMREPLKRYTDVLATTAQWHSKIEPVTLDAEWSIDAAPCFEVTDPLPVQLSAVGLKYASAA